MNDLPAGRELDVLVAKKVMGWTKPKGGRRDPLTGKRPVWRELPFEYVDTPHFSTDIAAAWEVVEKFHGDSPNIQIGKDGWEIDVQTAKDGNGWFVAIRRYRVEDYAEEHDYWGAQSYYAHAETAPLAICRAALAAVDPSGAQR